MKTYNSNFQHADGRSLTGWVLIAFIAIALGLVAYHAGRAINEVTGRIEARMQEAAR